MGRNDNIYTLPEQTVKSLSSGSWPEFLRSAAWNFRFPFQHQMMIYAQRPDATACYSFDDWHDRFSRRLKRGATGIVLINDSKDQLSLDYVFDYSDTYSRKGKKLSPWELTEQNTSVVRDVLKQEFIPDVPETDDISLYYIFRGCAASLLDEELETAVNDLMQVKDECRLSELNDSVIEDTFRKLVIDSATAMLMHRCGLDFASELPTDPYGLPENPFVSVEFFNSMSAMSVLGNTTQYISKQILREIALTVAKWDKEHENEEEKEHETSNNISSGRGVSDTESVSSETTGTQQVRENEESISERASDEPIHNPSDVRAVDGTSSPDGSDNTGADNGSDAGAYEEESASGEDSRNPQLDTAHGEPSQTSGGNGISGNDIQLNYYFDEAEITHALLRGSRVEGSKFRVQNAVVNDIPDLAGMLRAEYGIGAGTLIMSDGTWGSIDYDRKGIKLRAKGYEELHLSWSQVATRVKDLVNSGKYLSDAEKVQMDRYYEEQAALVKRQEVGETLKNFFDIHRDLMPETSIHRVNELVRAFVFENSEVATNELINIFRGLGEQEEIQDNSEAFTVLAEAFTELLNIAGTDVSQLVPSAMDAGVENPFPSEEALDEKEARRETPLDRNPEPLIDHPELITDTHFPPSREDKALLSDLMKFVGDYRVTFKLQTPELSEHDKEAYDISSEFIGNMVVTDEIYANAALIDTLVGYINMWFVPFSEGIKPEIISNLDSLLERADKFDADALYNAKQQKEGEKEEALKQDNEEMPVSDEPKPEPSEKEEGKFTEASFHVGDFYEDAYGKGIITRIYIPEKGVPHESSFGLVDPEASEDSRDSKGYVMSMPAAIARLNRGEAALTPGKERPPVSEPVSKASEEPHEPTLFDFDFSNDTDNGSDPFTPITEHFDEPVPEEQIQTPDIPSERINFKFPETVASLGGPKARFQSNIEAIRLLKKLEEEDRLANAEEQEILSKYVGWGGIQNAFDPAIPAWSKEYEELKELLTEEEYDAARESTMTAFYTPPEVSDAVFQVLNKLGFKRGNVLDPGCGIGSFTGRLPENMQESRVYGVEQDSISGRIAKQLYRKNNIIIDGYENTSFPDNFFDIAVGNVPFGAIKVRDKKYDKLNLQIHDYFFAKTLDKVRPGGVIAFVTSMGTLDKKNTEFRRYLSQRADLLGAIRLPNNTFKMNAGTDVTSDIIFLQKREVPRVNEAFWTDLDTFYDHEKQKWGPEVNAYFADNPEMILGEMTEISGSHGPEPACVARKGENLREALKRAADKISGDFIQPEQGLYDQEFENNERIPADPDVRNYSFTLVNDEVYFREDSEMYKPTLNKTAEKRVRGLIRLRERVRNLIDAQMEDYPDKTIHELQKLLNDDYDAFTKKYGLINSRGNELAFSDDSSYYLLCSLEHINDKGEFLGKADMFYKRTIGAHEKVEHVDTAEEALAVSLGERGRIDFDFMAELSGIDKDKLKNDLQGQIFQDPAHPGVYELAATYLSGNVRRKLSQAKAAEEEEPGVWTANIKALEGVQPQDLEPGDISVRLGTTWIPKEEYTQFMYELLDTRRWCRENGLVEVQYAPYTNVWNIKNITYDESNPKSNTTYGTRRMSAYRIIENSLNLKDVKIYDTVKGEDGKERRVLNQNDTLEAQEKQQLIKDAFKEWIWQDPERTERLCKIYNERFNSYVPPQYSDDLVQFHNLNPTISLRPWQKEAVARIMYSGNTLLAHAVGAGKTWTICAAAKEMKDLGLCNKSMIVVPNTLIGQWAGAVHELYPNAKVLTSTKKDFEPKNRKKFCSRIATGDFDIVIIGHSQFERIPLSPERQEAGIRDEINKIVDAIAEMKADNAEHFTIKQMERMKKNLEGRLDKLHNSKKRDNVINFEELGIDRLFVDESHEYKNLFLYTKMTNVAGISQTDSQKASDMFLKCRYIDEITGNKGNIHATGTPLSNTMAELYTTQRYLQYDLLKEMGLDTFDQWASTFGETVTSVELAPEGTGYRARTRFANFFNIPELMSIYCQCADIRTQDMLDLPLPTPHYENIVVPASDIQKEYVKSLGERAQAIHNGGVDPSEDNMLKITSDGRKLALDQRLIDPSWSDNPNSKVNACADNVYHIWQEHMDTKGTQLVFCDISTPNNKTFNVYDDLKEKLIVRGIPEDEVRFIHEAKTDTQKEALKQKVRDGEVRVLMGSTGKLGTGTNVQERLVAGHDLDCPWRPSDLEQRSGRVIRQGNTNDDVYIRRYVAEGTFDAYMYQLIENKQRFISQIFTSKPTVRSAADVDEIVMSFAEIKALASGNPLIKERVELEADIQRLQLLQARHENAQHRLKQRVKKQLPEAIKNKKALIAEFEKDCALVESQSKRTSEGHLIPAEVKGKVFEKASESGAAILTAAKRAPQNEVTAIGSLRGFTLAVDKTEHTYDGKPITQIKIYRSPYRKYSVGGDYNDLGLITRLNNILDKDLPRFLEESRQELDEFEHELEGAKTEIGKPFMKADELKEKQARLEEVSRQLDLDAQENNEHKGPETEPGRKPSLDSVINSAEARQTNQMSAPSFNPEKSIIE